MGKQKWAYEFPGSGRIVKTKFGDGKMFIFFEKKKTTAVFVPWLSFWTKKKNGDMSTFDG